MPKSAIYCGHANESPEYARSGDRLHCKCPEDCYCKYEGGRRNLRRIAVDLRGQMRFNELVLYSEDRLVAACTSMEALEAARRLFAL